MELKVVEYILLVSLLYDSVASSLFLSHQSEVKQENDNLSIICRDIDTGAAASWRGPKNRRLGDKTNPQAKVTSYGIRLIFTKIRKEDQGIYTCKTNTQSAEFQLFVEDDTETTLDNPTPEIGVETYTKPTKKYYFDTHTTKRYNTPFSTTTRDPIMFVGTPEVQEGEEGTDIPIRCEAKGGEITWLVDGEPPKEPKYEIMADGLLVRNASKEDAKIYDCKAIAEGTGNMRDQFIELRVTHAPRLPTNTSKKHYMEQEIVYAVLGETVNLTCEVEAEPPPTFNWFNKNRKQKIGEEINVSRHKSVLKLMMTSKNMGDYKCKAENKHGSLEVLFKLLNGTQPNPPDSLSLKEATSDSLTLEIEGPEPTEEEIKSGMIPLRYRVQYRNRSSDGNDTEWMAESFALTQDKLYTLTNLAHTTQYEVRAATENLASLSEFTNSSIFTTESIATNLNVASLASITFITILIVIFNGPFDSHI